MGARDRYQLPIALFERDALDLLVTDWYSGMDRQYVKACYGAMHRFVPFMNRYSEQLPSAKVKDSKQIALRQYLGKSLGETDYDRRTTDGKDAKKSNRLKK